MTWLDPKRIRHEIREQNKLIGGGYAIRLWCGWNTIVNYLSRSKAQADCIECLAQSEPHADLP